MAITVIDKIKQANNQSFKLIDAKDIDGGEGNRLKDEALEYTSSGNEKSRVILKKNSDFASLQSQITGKTNTIFEIRYEHDLFSGSISIPIGCELHFNGGAIKNGRITLNNTVCINPNFDNSNTRIIGNMLNGNREKINAIYYWVKDPNINIRNTLFRGSNTLVEDSYSNLKYMGINEFQVYFDTEPTLPHRPSFITSSTNRIYGATDIINHLVEKHYDVRSFKMHSNIGGVQTYVDAMKQFIIDIVDSGIFPNIETIFLTNEDETIYATEVHLDMYITAITYLKNRYPNIIFSMVFSSFSDLWYSNSLPLKKFALNNVNDFGSNLYPYLCDNKEISFSMYLDDFHNKNLNIFQSFRDVSNYVGMNLNQVYVTECGCNDYEDGGYTGGSDTVNPGVRNSKHAIEYTEKFLESYKKCGYKTIYSFRWQDWSADTRLLGLELFKKLKI